MQIFSLNFLIHTLCGIWRPIEWSSNGVKLLYNVFTFIVIFSHYFLALTQFMDIILIVDNIDDFATNTLMFLTVVAVTCKATVVVMRRNAITNLIQVLTKTPCKPRDEDEAAIQTKFDMFIRSCSLKYLLLTTTSVTGTTIGSVLNVMHGHLPYRIWLPWNNNAPMVFWIISIHQIITVIFSAMINVGTDTLIIGLILQTCTQFEIFESRLHKLIISKTVGYLGRAFSSSNQNKTEISDCICHHLSIYKYAKTVNIIFNQVLFVQFFASILVLCTSVYYLSIHIAELFGAATFLVYTIGMFVQIYIYCWSGNEVILKSMSVEDAIYCMNWPLLSINEKKELMMIMIRSTIPIKFTSSFFITLSLQSYNNVSSTVMTSILIPKNINIYSARDYQQISIKRAYTFARIDKLFVKRVANTSNMQILSLNFLIYTLCGIWRPIKWSSNSAKLLYSVFTFIVIFSQYFLVFTQFMDIILVVDNIDDFATNTLMFLTIIAVCCKATVVVMRRNEIINLVQVLMREPCKPRDEDEAMIQTKFDKFIRSYSIKYSLLATGSVIGTTIGSIFNIMRGHLPYRVWLPSKYNVPLVFRIVSIHQIITIILATMINVGTETLVFGLFIQTCAQLEIFESRLHKLINSKSVGHLGHGFSSLNQDKIEIPDCVRHHLSIFKYAKTINVIFNQVLFVQFFASILVLCTSVYYLSMNITDLSGTAPLLVYTICMFVQIYVYCWSGNEVILKSMNTTDSIYHTDWPVLSVDEKKKLLMIMIRSTIPIKFTSSFLITLSLQSYNNILKASYSAFNVLKK
ncbi:uncharacterized protein LOC105199424 [Solenopsis invicta]|uniref:uncharacterized protein LOC105199424 n=1 Tax=Solenopsis invicta TaxID=13686 RepID=UPI00193D1048|nr:uncharacterized protein LOC105199424 [Solenopsis invicta]